MIKKIYDSVHRFIHIDPLEKALIDTKPFQRLHSIHQLGVTFFVYPGGTHRRFEHSLGVMELATRIYDAITRGDLPHHLPKKAADLVGTYVPAVGSFAHRYWRRALRLGALCHDLGHLPFSHVAEHRLLGKEGHEKWTLEIMCSPFLKDIWEVFQKECEKEGIDREVKKDVIKMALGEKKCLEIYPEAIPFNPWERIVADIISGDFFGADRMDYLLRDSQCTGLSYGVFDYHQLIEMLEILPSLDEKEELAIGVEENGIASCEALLLARHYMYKRLYEHGSVKAYSFHLSRFMQTAYGDLGRGLGTGIEHYIRVSDNEVMASLNLASTQEDHPGHFDATCLYNRENRFSSIALRAPAKREDLKKIEEKLGIPKEKIAWEITGEKEGSSGCFFPVLCRDGTIDSGDNLSDISIPLKGRSWGFVAPEYEKSLRKQLKKEGFLR